MKLRVLLYLLAFLMLSPTSVRARHVQSSSPYLSGDTFRAMCDLFYDEVSSDFDPKKVVPGDCIFVKTDMLDGFFATKHPYIESPYVIVSHNADHPAPGPGLIYLDDPKIVAWFAQNAEIVHPKLHPIPIGIANIMWYHGSVSILENCRKIIEEVPRSKWLYMNFSISTSPQERQTAYDFFIDKPYCTTVGYRIWDQYLLDLADVYFVPSPRGNGLDCLRTWEALYMGAYPIVKHSTLDAVFEGLPVVIIKDWSEVTQEFLEKKLLQIWNMDYTLEQLYEPYWRKKIESAKEQARKSVNL